MRINLASVTEGLTLGDGERLAPRLVQRDNCWARAMGPYFISKNAPLYADVTLLTRALMPQDHVLADLLAEWVPDEAQRRKVLVDNPAQLYGF